MIKNYNHETIDKLERILNKGLVSDVHKALLEDHKFLGSYKFKKVGLLDCTVERKLYRDLDTGSLVIVDMGKDYEADEGSYTPFYYVCVYVVDEELRNYEYDLYYEY